MIAIWNAFNAYPCFYKVEIILNKDFIKIFLLNKMGRIIKEKTILKKEKKNKLKNIRINVIINIKIKK